MAVSFRNPHEGVRILENEYEWWKKKSESEAGHLLEMALIELLLMQVQMRNSSLMRKFVHGSYCIHELHLSFTNFSDIVNVEERKTQKVCELLERPSVSEINTVSFGGKLRGS